MASLLASLLIKLGLDSAELRSGLSDSERAVQQSTARIRKFGESLITAGKVLSVGFSAPLTAYGVAATNAAIDAQELQSAFDQTFVNMSKAMNQWAEATGDSMGRSTQSLQQAANTFGIFFNQAAPTRQAAMEMSKTFTVLAQDLASFYNVAEDDALQKLRSGLSGESEPLRDFGVFLNEAAVEAEGLKSGLVKTGQEMTEQQKIIARYNLILAATKNAQGDVARTGDGAANTIRKAQAAWSELQVTLGTKVIPVLTPLVDKLAGVLNGFAALSPQMQEIILVSGAVAIAFGPILVAVGTLTATILSRLIPSLGVLQVAFWRTAAVMTSTAAASAALATALRLLMIATGVGAAIAVLAGAVYLFGNRAREAVPASAAYSRALATAEQTARDAKVASENLAKAMGEERKAAMAATVAEHALAASRLKAAQARLIQAETDARATAAEAKRRVALADGGGPGEGIRGRVSTNQQRFNTARSAAGTAEANLAAAQRTVISLQETKAGLEKDIANALNPVKLPPISVAGLDAGTAAADRAGRAVGGIGKAAQEAKAAADELQSIMDRLFPEVAEKREFEKQLKLIEQSKMAEDKRAEAVRALRREYQGLHRDLIAVGPGQQYPVIEVVEGTKSIERISADVSDRFGETMENLNKKAGATKVQVVKSMQDMVTDMMSAFDRLVGSIRGGGFLDILQSVIGVGLKLGDVGLFGKSIQTRLQKVPGNANGTNNWRGGLSIVGERGPELLNMPRGSQVKTNSELNAMMRGSAQRNVVEIVDTTGLFQFKVSKQILEASPAIMDGSARVTTSRAVRKQMRRVA